MQVSIVIPTYNRVNDLDECLNSIIIQTILPQEVIIVDDSDNDEIMDLIERRKNGFRDISIDLIYIRNTREKSSAIARNIGLENATCDIILFLDSDVLLDGNYIKEILGVYKEKTGAVGVQGLIQGLKTENKVIDGLMGMFYRFFYIELDEKNKFRVLPSLGVSNSPVVDKIINCEWLSGANQSYKSEIVKDFKWDENLKRYALCEDLDISYRIFKKYPRSLFMTPNAKLIHKSSEEGRTFRREVIYMDVIYRTYLFYKDVDQNLKNKLIYIWSRIGRMVGNIGYSIFKSESKLTGVRYAVGALFYCMLHLEEIKRGDLEFFNKGLR